jgi:hypothetical protein
MYMRTNALRIISTRKDPKAFPGLFQPTWTTSMGTNTPGPQQPIERTLGIQIPIHHASIHQMEIWSNAAMESRHRRVLYRLSQVD